jgi:hypothetical protein
VMATTAVLSATHGGLLKCVNELGGCSAPIRSVRPFNDRYRKFPIHLWMTGCGRYGELSIKQRIFCQRARRTKPAKRRGVGCRGRWQKIAWTKPPAGACELWALNARAAAAVAALRWQSSGFAASNRVLSARVERYAG